MKTIFYMLMMVLLLAMPKESAQAAQSALAVWGLDVVPSLFPYMVLCQSLSSMQAGENGMRRWGAFVLGLLGGSPSASASLSLIVQANTVSKRSLLFMTACAGTISPMFFLGSAANWFSSPVFARQLLVAQYAGALMAGGIVYLCSNNTVCGAKDRTMNVQRNSENPISRSVHAIMNVGGCIVFYSTVASCARRFIPFKETALPECFHAILEVSGGLQALSQIHLADPWRSIFAAGLCGFGGFSILSQNCFFLRTVGLNMKTLAGIAALRGILSALTMAALHLMRAAL